MPAEAQQQAREILRRVLVGLIEVVPNFQDSGTWAFFGYSRFEGVLAGGLRRGEAIVVHTKWHPRDVAGDRDRDPRDAGQVDATHIT